MQYSVNTLYKSYLFSFLHIKRVGINLQDCKFGHGEWGHGEQTAAWNPSGLETRNSPKSVLRQFLWKVIRFQTLSSFQAFCSTKKRSTWVVCIPLRRNIPFCGNSIKILFISLGQFEIFKLNLAPLNQVLIGTFWSLHTQQLKYLRMRKLQLLIVT